MIQNISNKADGKYICTVTESNEPNEIQVSYLVTVKSKYCFKIKTNRLCFYLYII